MGCGSASRRAAVRVIFFASRPALGDAGEDQGEVAGAEGGREVGLVVGDGALAERGGELLAVVDEFADEREQAAGAALWGEVDSGGRGGHERRKNTK